MKSKIYDIVSIFMFCLILGFGRSLILQDINIIKKTSEILESVPERITEVILINLELSKKLFNNHAVFIDSRDSSIYIEGHIEGSINIPWESYENNKIIEKLSEIKYDQDIVIYCSGDDCTLSIDLGEYIFYELSYERVFIFEGGYPLWIENNLPIKRLCQIDESREFYDENCIYVE